MAELENVIQNIIDDSFETDDVNTLLMASASDIENIIINKGEEPDYIFEKEGEYSGWPFRSFRGTQYSGGFSDHLPIVCTVNFSNIKKI